jgi:hypothetical protein
MTSTWMQFGHDHFDAPEVMAAIEESPFAVLLDVRLRLWASSQETAGQITPAAARSLGRQLGLDRDGIDEAVGILVDVGLWLPTDGGWLLQDHAEIAERERRIAQARADGAKRAAKSRGDRPTRQDEQLDLAVGRVTRTPSEGRARTSRDREEKRREEKNPLTPTGETQASDPSPLVDVDGLAAALDAALHPDTGPLPEPALRALRRHAEQLATIGATPTQVTDAVHRYRTMWPAMPVTAKAVVKHWATLTAPATAPALALVPDPDTAMRERARHTARNLATVLDTLTELDDLLTSKGLADWLDDAHTEWHRIRSAA